MTEVFNLLSSLRMVKEQKLIFTETDEYIISQFYKLVKRYISMKQFRSGIERYQLDTMDLNMYHVCDILTENIIKKYGK